MAAFAGVGAVSAVTFAAAASSEFFFFFFKAALFFFVFGVLVEEVASCYELEAAEDDHFG